MIYFACESAHVGVGVVHMFIEPLETDVQFLVEMFQIGGMLLALVFRLEARRFVIVYIDMV